jgi:hypothetical protein
VTGIFEQPTPIEKITEAVFPLIVIGEAETHTRFGFTSDAGLLGVFPVVSVDVLLDVVSPACVCVPSLEGVVVVVASSAGLDEDVSPDALWVSAAADALWVSPAGCDEPLSASVADESVDGVDWSEVAADESAALESAVLEAVEEDAAGVACADPASPVAGAPEAPPGSPA